MLGFVIPGLDAGDEVIQVTPTRSIGPFTAQVTLEERHDDEMVITDHPVESGAVVSDHAYMLPSSLVLRVGWSESPSGGGGGGLGALLGDIGGDPTGLTSLTAGQGVGSPREMYENMLQLQKSRVPFEIQTGKRIYQNMLVRRISTSSDKENENVFIASIECREVLIAFTQVVSVAAPADAQAEPESTTPTAEKGTKSLSSDAPHYNAAAGEASAAASNTN